MKAQKSGLAILSIILIIGVLISAGCDSKPQTPKAYKKLIMQQFEDGGYISGATPYRYNEETGAETIPLINTNIYDITRLGDVKVLEFAPVPRLSKEDIKSDDFSLEDSIFEVEGISTRCKFSILMESIGPYENLEVEEVTAILAEVSIAEMREASMNVGFKGAAEIFKKKVKINNEYLNQTTRVWFLGYTVPSRYEGEEAYYTVDVACFEDLDYFDNLVEYKSYNIKQPY